MFQKGWLHNRRNLETIKVEGNEFTLCILSITIERHEEQKIRVIKLSKHYLIYTTTNVVGSKLSFN